MKDKMKKSLKFISLALIPILIVSIICMSGSAADFNGTEMHQSWGDLPSALPNGTVNFYKVSCRKAIDNTTADVYLKAVKSPQGELCTYEFYDNVTMHGTDTELMEKSSYFDVVISTSFNFTDKVESWNVMLKDVPDNPYSGILSVSPLTTTVKSTQTWDGKINENGASKYIEVSRETIVKYALKDGSSTVLVFYVKKDGESSQARLQLSIDGQNWNDNSIVFNGKTINALLVAAYSDTQPESWIFTVTGYDRLSNNGKLIEYIIDKVDINSTQAWRGVSTQLKQTFGGTANENGTYVYSLKLKSGTNEFTVLQIEKEMTNGAVTSLAVRGAEDSMTTFSTVTYAVSDVMNQDFDYPDNSITFNNLSNIRVSDIMNSESGVTVNFNIGTNNGSASVTLKLTGSGKLSYDFDGLPADEFTPDNAGQDGLPIAVSSYEVVATVI